MSQVTHMSRTNGRSRGRDVALAAVLLLPDVLLIAWSVYAVGITQWADGFDSRNPPEWRHVAGEYMWVTLAGAVISAGVLLRLRYRIAVALQLLLLGGTSALFAVMTAG